MRKSFRQIAAYMDPVKPPTSLARLIEMHQRVGQPRSFREIWRRHNHPQGREQAFLFLNTFLMDIHDADVTDGTKPAVKARAHEIGQFIRDYIDIAALAEVWLERERNRILAQWPEERRPHRPEKGPPPHFVESISPYMPNSAGLLFISQELRIADRSREGYLFASGFDSLADKGVLRTVLDVGVGPSKLEIYTTHLNAGARLVRLLQLFQLSHFVRSTHHPSNPALIVGDFNIGAHSPKATDPDELLDDLSSESEILGLPPGSSARAMAWIEPFREVLLRLPGPLTDHDVLNLIMRELGFKDLWVWRNGTPGYTSYMERPEVPELICQRAGGDPDIRYCDDFRVPAEPPKIRVDGEDRQVDRLDYVFVSEASAAHSFTLDFTRPRRVTIERARDAPGRDKIGYISDHLGIATTLLIAPASRPPIDPEKTDPPTVFSRLLSAINTFWSTR